MGRDCMIREAPARGLLLRSRFAGTFCSQNHLANGSLAFSSTRNRHSMTTKRKIYVIKVINEQHLHLSVPA